MEYNLRNAMACLPQSWNWLENGRSKDDEMSGGMWKAMETKAEKVRIAEVEKRREERRGKRKIRRKE